jgi:hypothetical protein
LIENRTETIGGFYGQRGPAVDGMRCGLTGTRNRREVEMSHDKNVEDINNDVDDLEIELTDDDLSLDELTYIDDPHVSDVPVRLEALSLKGPSNTTYFRTAEKDLWQNVTALFDEDSDDRRFYIVPKKIIPVIKDRKLLRAVILVPYTTLESKVGLWPLKRPVDLESPSSKWYLSAKRICEKAQTTWMRKKNAGGEWQSAEGQQNQEPWWPDNFDTNLIKELALEAITITSTQHPMIKRLRGKA